MRPPHVCPSRVCGLIVVESNLFPYLFRVAIRTGFPRAIVMLVVLLMATVAVRRCVTVFDLGLVASFAFDLFCVSVRVSKNKIRL